MRKHQRHDRTVPKGPGLYPELFLVLGLHIEKWWAILCSNYKSITYWESCQVLFCGACHEELLSPWPWIRAVTKSLNHAMVRSSSLSCLRKRASPPLLPLSSPWIWFDLIWFISLLIQSSFSITFPSLAPDWDLQWSGLTRSGKRGRLPTHTHCTCSTERSCVCTNVSPPSCILEWRNAQLCEENCVCTYSTSQMFGHNSFQCFS